MPDLTRANRSSCLPFACAAGFFIACSAPRDTSSDPLDLSFTPPSAWSGDDAGPSAAASDADVESLPLSPWWQDFADPALDAEIRAALRLNPNLRRAAAQVDAARAHARAVAGAQAPELNAALDLSRGRSNLLGLPIPGAQEIIPYTTNAHGLGLQMAWELDLWSRLDAAAQSAARDSQAVQAEREGLALALSGQIARSWLILIQQSALTGILERRAQIAEQMLALTRRRLADGTGSAAAITASSAVLSSRQADLARARAGASDTRTQLAALCGRYPTPAAVHATPPALPPLPPPPPAGLPAELLARRPDLAAAELRVRAARSRAQMADAALLPRVVLTASGGSTATDLSDLLSGDFRVWSLAGSVFAPIFAGGRLRAEADAAQAESAAFEAEYVGRALTAFAEVESALASEFFLREVWQRQQDLTAAWTREAALAQRRFTAGSGDASAVLAAADLALEAEAAEQASALLLLLNRVDLHLALGGGFTAATTE
jgi:NodT family efflux transporter outer membrane factor (OMF) lipoprotein